MSTLLEQTIICAQSLCVKQRRLHTTTELRSTLQRLIKAFTILRENSCGFKRAVIVHDLGKLHRALKALTESEEDHWVVRERLGELAFSLPRKQQELLVIY